MLPHFGDGLIEAIFRTENLISMIEIKAMF
jgi:hypothetical protein